MGFAILHGGAPWKIADAENAFARRAKHFHPMDVFSRAPLRSYVKVGRNFLFN